MKLPFIEAGEIVTTHGVRGEMKILPWADGPDFLVDFKRVRIGGAEYKVESCRIQKTYNLLKVKGIDTMEAAQAMRGQIIELYRSDISDDVIFADELKGVEVAVWLDTLEKLSGLTEGYLQTQLERGFSALDFYKSLLI
mgnify:CR=1 FL=1